MRQQQKGNRCSNLLMALSYSVVLLILTVTLKIVLEYVNYFPANFQSDFLQGRHLYFFDSYCYPFYAHIVAGPITLIVGLLLLNERFRSRYRSWHIRLGKLLIALVTGVLAPSGLWMALYADGGWIGKTGFAAFSVLTFITAVQAFRTAVMQDFVSHQVWTWRCYVLLCSAVATRVWGGAALTLGNTQDWSYYVSAWGSWLIPLLGLELFRMRKLMMTHLKFNATSHQ